ncbi:TIGR04255 family protein [Aphanothece hegewaldii CCALA 016]|uniref:TIGR04255 family protein n=1 Tax=Aphanothece hegewaldii CCALA 016 TaxID=2107694 RepID=A0A2T1LXH8_9CHRO|nr:TIGR04255 family protein [Aphanothece hegewaldii]PSF37090.1 TIGR04255 family protein [Aphanothece hegewaldii CCALA 016]
MNLPELERVIYERNPLVEVVCQLRFPPILKISHQEPVEFQDKIRLQYPLFEITQSQVPSEIVKVVQQFGLPLQSDIAYSFRSEDQKWHLSITKDFIALTTSKYERYEQFKQRLKEAVEIFEKIYEPSFYTRVGLRYQDLIIRSNLELEDKNWSDLIAKHIASELHDSELSSLIQTLSKNMVLKTEDVQVILNHGLVTVKEPHKEDEVAYLFDADFYIEQKIKRDGNVWNVLDQFNKSARKLFRWSITDTLHKAMQPQRVDETKV